MARGLERPPPHSAPPRWRAASASATPMPETDPAITPVCPACGSDALVRDAFLYDGKSMMNGATTSFGLGVFAAPGALIRKEPATSPAHYRVCGDCGLAMLFADDPRTLWDGYVDRLSREL